MLTEAPEALILDLLEWLSPRERTYEEAMNAWRTSCPRLPVWEDANDRGFIGIERRGSQSFVRLTSSGAEFLKRFRSTPRPKNDRSANI
jgi:D-3-phosphoglycerate dehydrogenase / 2-oxoglutarate reductase